MSRTGGARAVRRREAALLWSQELIQAKKSLEQELKRVRPPPRIKSVTVSGFDDRSGVTHYTVVTEAAGGKTFRVTPRFSEFVSLHEAIHQVRDRYMTVT